MAESPAEPIAPLRPPPERLFTAPFALAWAANLALGLCFFLFVHLSGFLEGLGASEVTIGALFATTAITSIAIRPRVGRAMDQIGRRPVIVVGSAINVIVVALYLTVTAIGPWVYVVRALHGVAQAFLFTALFTYAADRVPASRRTEGLALFGISGILPIALGGLIGDAVLATAGYDALFVTSTILAIVVLALALLLPEPRMRRTRASLGRRPFLRVLERKDLLPLWFITGVFTTALASYVTFLKTWVEETGVGSVGMFFAAYTVVAVLLRVFLGSLPDRVGPRRVLYPTLGLYAACFGVLALATNAAWVLAAGALCGAGHAFSFPILYAMVIVRTPEADRGSGVAVYTAMYDVGFLVGGPLFGAIIALGGYEMMFVTAGAAVAVGTLVFARWDRANLEPR